MKKKTQMLVIRQVSVSLFLTLFINHNAVAYISYSGNVVPAPPWGDQWSTDQTIIVGDTVSGQLSVADGSQLSSGGAIIANYNSSIPSEVTVENAGSIWTIAGDFIIGQSGAAIVSVQDKGQISVLNGVVEIGNGFASYLYVRNPDTMLTTDAAILVGNTGTGSMIISNGGAVSAETVFVAQGQDAVGNLSVSGENSRLTVADVLHIGEGGKGTLNISAGGKITQNNSAVLGVSAGSDGTASVEGATSQWLIGGSLLIGNFGTGSVSIADGGTVTTTGYTALGINTGSSGNLLVSGSGSMLETSRLDVGTQGEATLVIANGGTIIDNLGIIGDRESTGSVLVTGGHSLWQNLAPLYVGGFAAGTGSGELTISDDARVQAAQVYIARYAGATGIINIGSAPGGAPTAAGYIDSPIILFGGGDGTLNFNHATNDYRFDSAITGDGRVNVLAGDTVFTASNTYSGVTTISGGDLRAGGDNVFSPNSTYDVDTGGTLDTHGYSQTLGDLRNAGIVSLQGDSAGARLTINGDYTGANGVLSFNTALGGDDSPSDRLIITGDTAGTSYVRVNNLGGSGAATLEGIPLIEVGGSPTASLSRKAVSPPGLMTII
ncbi:autotransporter outer membrane beta-barrel domain-containing protein [Martelella alba]|uniref:Autotransporter outer membrane beta-barrel domain-containing protein n=1 Tax=Martelella alba TaxID=2590451 RepID=A0ABY2SGP7_9HYPH|nr:autotransporter outer membrane beta-barrel domain-containing protein [Martelella alba]